MKQILLKVGLTLLAACMLLCCDACSCDAYVSPVTNRVMPMQISASVLERYLNTQSSSQSESTPAVSEPASSQSSSSAYSDATPQPQSSSYDRRYFSDGRLPTTEGYLDYLTQPEPETSSQATSSQATSSKSTSSSTTSSKTTSSKSTSSKTSSSSSSGTSSIDPDKEYTKSQLLKMTIEQVKEINKDFYGFLRLPGVPINEPVVLTDNMDTYHRYDFYHNYDRYGTIYLQSGTSWTSLDKNTVAYGHNRGKSAYNAKMFGPLVKFRKLGYVQENPYIYLESPHGNYKFQIFTVMLCHGTVEHEDNYMRTSFSSVEEAGKFFNHMKDDSLFDIGVSVNGNDKIITLVTCVYDFDDARLVIMGKLVD